MIQMRKQAARFNIEDASPPEDILEQALHHRHVSLATQTHQAP
jgi:hypothetical protein